MRIQSIRDFEPTGEIVIEDNRIVSGTLPSFLDGTVRNAIEKNQLEEALDYYCNSVGNNLSLRQGFGLRIVRPALALDADDEPTLSDLLTDRAVAKTKAAIAQWMKIINKQIATWNAEGLSLLDIRDRIPGLYASLSGQALSQQLNQSMQMGYLGGRDEVLEELAADGNDEGTVSE